MPAPKETFKNSNIPKPIKLPKGKIEKIDFKEHEQEVRRICEGKPPDKLVERWKEQGLRSNQEKYYTSPSTQSRFNSIKKLVGYSSNKVGFCCQCRSLNTFLVKYKTQGITIVERYCSEHVPDNLYNH